MIQTDGRGRHNSVNFGLFSVKMPKLGVRFVLNGKGCFHFFFIKIFVKYIYGALKSALYSNNHGCTLTFNFNFLCFRAKLKVFNLYQI